MAFNDWLCLLLFPVVFSLLAFPLGEYMAKVFSGQKNFLTPVAAPSRSFSIVYLG